MHAGNNQPQTSGRRTGLAVASLAFGAFSSVTTEFIPVGVLPDVAATFQISDGQAGMMMTLPGILGALAAPGILIAAGRIDRKLLLLGLSTLLLISALLSALAPSWTVMLISRGLAGLSLGAFWAMGLAVAGSLVPKEKSSTAIAMVFAGVTLAMVLGVPLGSMVAERFSWRGAFIAASILAALSLTMQALVLPRIPATEPTQLRSLWRFTAQPQGLKSLLLIMLIYGTHFGTYTFVAPLLRQGNVSLAAITWTLLGFGIAGFVANFIASRFVGRLQLTLTVGLLLFAAALATLALLDQAWILIVAVLLWGAAWGAVPLCLNIGNRIASGEEIEAGSAMFTFTAQLSIAAGSAVGGVIVDRAGIGADFTSGGGVILLSVLLLWGWNVRTAGKRAADPQTGNEVRNS